MSRRLGTTAPSYFRYEKGENLPRPKLWKILKKEFDISMDWFFYDIGPMTLSERNNEGKTLIDNGELEKLKQEPVHLTQELAQTKEQLKKKAALEIFQGLEGVAGEVKELVTAMAQDALLKHEILGHFLKYNKEK